MSRVIRDHLEAEILRAMNPTKIGRVTLHMSHTEAKEIIAALREPKLDEYEQARLVLLDDHDKAEREAFYWRVFERVLPSQALSDDEGILGIDAPHTACELASELADAAVKLRFGGLSLVVQGRQPLPDDPRARASRRQGDRSLEHRGRVPGSSGRILWARTPGRDEGTEGASGCAPSINALRRVRQDLPLPPEAEEGGVLEVQAAVEGGGRVREVSCRIGRGSGPDPGQGPSPL